jgi:hypothetical protein
MTMRPNESIGQAYLAAARQRLAACHERVRHCLAQLNDTQAWWRPRPDLNSVANLVLHLCGNLRQWIVAGVGGAADDRDRPQEFTERGPLPREKLLRRLADVVAEADAVLGRTAEARLLEPRRIQGFDATVLSAVFDSISHLAGHTQEIVSLTRLQLGEGYRFAWAPATAEQGAPSGKEVAEATDLVFEQGTGIPPAPPPVPVEERASPPPEAPVREGGESGPGPSPTPPLGDYVREIGQEFQREEDEGKLR